MRLHLAVIVFACAALVVAGCARKAMPTPIDSLEVKKDEPTGFAMKVPSNWTTQHVPGQLLISTSQSGIARRFLDFKEAEGGAKVELRAVVLDSTRTIDSLILNSQLEFEDGLNRYTTEKAKLGGLPATKLVVMFDQADGEYRSEQYFAEQDSIVTIVTFAAFGGTFEDYTEEFAEILASVKCAKPIVKRTVDTVGAPTGPEPPSDTLRAYNASDFAIQIPQNFKGEKTKTSGLSSVNFVGSRLDCNIQVDVFDASKQNKLDKIIEQNKGSYGGSATSTTLGGQPAKYFTYNPTPNITSRAYFTVKGNKMYRITVNMFKPEQSVYLPIFEKSIKTIAFK